MSSSHETTIMSDFTEMISGLVKMQILPSIVTYLHDEKNVTVTVDELSRQLQLPESRDRKPDPPSLPNFLAGINGTMSPSKGSLSTSKGAKKPPMIKNTTSVHSNDGIIYRMIPKDPNNSALKDYEFCQYVFQRNNPDNHRCGKLSIIGEHGCSTTHRTKLVTNQETVDLSSLENPNVVTLKAPVLPDHLTPVDNGFSSIATPLSSIATPLSSIQEEKSVPIAPLGI